MLFALLILLLATAAAATPLAGFAKRTPLASPYASKAIATHRRPAAFREPCALARTDNVLSLTRKESPAGSRLLRNIRSADDSSVNGTYGTTGISSASEGQILLTSIQVGGEWFEAVLDTGSSDTWLVQTGFNCKNNLGSNVSESYCKFGDTYDVAPTFAQIPDQNFRISYADGESLTGIIGHEKVTLANITVYNQTIGVVNEAAWNGDGVSSGLIGLAYPALTSAYNGTNITADTRASKIPYNPIFTNMFTYGDVEPLFTITLERGNGSSTLALGGLPPAEPGFEDLEFTSVPIEVMQLNPGQDPRFKTQNSYYTITPDGFVYRNATSGRSGNWTSCSESNSSVPEQTLSTRYPTIVDSGTSLVYLPQSQVLYVNAAFDPPAVLDPESGYAVIPCNASAPEFGVLIGGVAFYINAEDMILDLGLGGGMCASGVQNGGGAVNILGDVFMRNVIAVFDVGAAEMRFAPHVYY